MEDKDALEKSLGEALVALVFVWRRMRPGKQQRLIDDLNILINRSDTRALVGDGLYRYGLRKKAERRGLRVIK